MNQLLWRYSLGSMLISALTLPTYSQTTSLPPLLPESLTTNTIYLSPQPTGDNPILGALANKWGLIPVSCSSEATIIFMETKSVCVQPTSVLTAGRYIYSPQANYLQRFEPPNAPLPQFTFTNALTYSNCVEGILQMYQSPSSTAAKAKPGSCAREIAKVYGVGGLTQAQALNILQAADAYATQGLSSRLYPPRGQRDRIADLFGLRYKIDPVAVPMGK